MAHSSKILFLTLRTFSAIGGIERVCKIVGMVLGEFGANVKVFSMYDSTNDVQESYISRKSFIGFNKRKFKFLYKSIIAGIKTDVILLSHINLLSIGYIIKIFSPKTKLVLFAHGIEVWTPLSFLRKKMIKRCDRLIAVSHFTKEKLITGYRLDPNKITVLNNCIDPYLPRRHEVVKHPELQARYGFTDSNIVLLTLSRLSSKELYKGYDNVLVAVSHLREKYSGIKYMIIGSYDEQEKRRIDAIIEMYSLQNNVILTGYVPDNELEKHYRLADLYVMPSKKEGFGIVFIEAMYYGLPVIAGNKDGSADALCDGKLGLLVNPDNQQEIDDAIETVILDKHKYKPDDNLLTQMFGYESYRKRFEQVLMDI